MEPTDKKEEWLNRLRESVKDYREPVSPNSWQRIERAMAEAEAGGGGIIGVERRRKSITYRVIGGVSAVAAAILIFFIVNPFLSNNATEDIPSIAVVDNAKKIDNNTFNGNGVANNNLQNIVDILAVTKVKTNKKEIADSNIDYNNINVDISSNVQEYNNKELEHKEQTQQVQQTQETKQTKKELTWEEYLQQMDNEDKIDKKGTKKRSGKWLAFSVGNNGVGTFDTKVENFTNIGKQYSVAPELDMSSVKDLALYKKPENMILPTGVANIEPEYKHKQPISFGVTFGKNISSKFNVETGLVYSLLSSDVENLQKDKIVKQTLHYLGIPIRFNWNFINKSKYAVYTGAGVLIEKCIYGKIGGEKINIKSVETSLNFSVGAQYKFNQHIGIYFEPGLCYYLGMEEDGFLGKTSKGTTIKSIHSQEPLGFTLQAGLRFSF